MSKSERPATLAKAPPASEVRAQLSRILASRKFTASRRLADFLSFVVEEALADRIEELKARVISVRVFGRDSADSSQDPLVRIQAHRLRRALDDYYAGEGADDPVCITIPKGGYVPSFTHRDQRSVEQAENWRQRPSIAVMPFASPSEDSENDGFVDGLCAELTAKLAQFRHLTVISYYASSHCKESGGDVSQTGLDLGVDYLITGRIRRDSQTLFVQVELCRTDSLIHLWSQQFERTLRVSELLTVQQEIIQHIATSVADDYGVIAREHTRAAISADRDPTNLTAYEAVLTAHHYNNVLTPEALSRAIEALEHAVRLDPNYAEAWAMLGCPYFDAFALDLVQVEGAMAKLEHAARRAMSLDPSLPHSHHAMLMVEFLHRNRSGVLASAQRMLDANPNAGWTVAAGGWWMALAGDFERGLPLIQQQIQLSPYYPGHLHAAPCLYHYYAMEYESAHLEANRFATPDLFWDPLLRAVCLAQLDREDQARAAMQEVLRLRPEFTHRYRHYLRCYIFEEQWMEHLLDGLKKAGFEPQD